MKRMTLITGAALAVVASAALAFATAHAETKPVVTNHETAITCPHRIVAFRHTDKSAPCPLYAP